MKVAVLSNVNIDYIVTQLSRQMDICRTEGYGDVWGQLLNKQSSVHRYKPDVIVIIMDISQLLDAWEDRMQAMEIIDEWFVMYEKCMQKHLQYLISDVKFREMKIQDPDECDYDELEYYWKEKLFEKIKLHTNTHYLALGHVAESIGLCNFYSKKAWYLGKMPYSQKGSCLLADEMKRDIQLIGRVSKKVLVLDLDETLWGGILGECGANGIQLSDENIGAVFKDVQKIVKKMQKRGVLLAICSKNNPGDVRKVWESNSHMILQEKDFVACYINWDDKAQNLKKLSKELNLGPDSFVFVDDMPVERENIRCQLPMVTVPEFPIMTEELPEFFQKIYVKYFMKMRSTDEDRNKTKQYQENRVRAQVGEGMDYRAFLKSLRLKAERVAYNELTKDRIVQLMGKTNQFNLTGRRYSKRQLDEKVAAGWEIYAYRVSDKFGDYGIVAVIIVDIAVPAIDCFFMSCRIMGKQMENYFISQVEEELAEKGYGELQAEYIPSERNMPVKDFYPNMGYTIIEQNAFHSIYTTDLSKHSCREYYVKDLERKKS